MSSIHLEVIDGRMSWDIPLERRITILKGDSGTGKSTMVEAIENPSNVTKITCPLKCIPVTDATWRLVMGSAEGSLIIFDDMEIVETSEFASLVKETEVRGNYYLLICRELIGIGSLGSLSIAVNSILYLCCSSDGLRHYTRKLIDVESKPTKAGKIDTVLVEDSRNGKKFFENLFKKINVVSSTNGKSSIVKDILSYYKDRSILLFVDMAAFGCHIEELLDRTVDVDVCFDTEYECFEELLLRSKFFSNDKRVISEFSNIWEYANKYNSWEVYFEVLLKEVSSDKPFRTGHDLNLNYCWKNDCFECRRHVVVDCKYYINGNKMLALLKETKYEYLLGLI